MSDQSTKLAPPQDEQGVDAKNTTKNTDQPNVTINQDNPGNVSKSDNIDPESPVIVATDTNNIKNVTADVSHTEKDKRIPEKKSIHFDDSHIDVASYLRSEFSTTEKLPKYKEIEMLGYDHIFTDKKSVVTKIVRSVRGKKHNHYSGDTTVQFQIFGSENMPDTRVLMEYEPETEYKTVKGMFVILMLLHLFTWIASFLLWSSRVRDGFLKYGYLMCIPPFVLYIILVITVTCFQTMRRSGCAFCSIILAYIFLSIGTAAIAGYLSARIFNFSLISMACTDLVCVILGCFKYDYTNKRLYVIATGFGAVFLCFFIPTMDIVCTKYIYYWGEFPKETILSYIICFIFTMGSLAVIVAELHLLLGGEWVELGEDDYTFGGFLLFVSLIDFPIRLCRKFGLCGQKGDGDDDEE